MNGGEMGSGTGALEDGSVSPTRDDDAPLLRGALGFEVFIKSLAKAACMGANDIVVARIVVGRAVKDPLANGSLIQSVGFTSQRALADEKKEIGKTASVDEAPALDNPLNEKPPWVFFKKT
jgi:hypothetical protein